MIRKHLISICILFSGLTPVMAEEIAEPVYAPADTSALSLGEVSVTAIKQAFSLLRQPVTVTTINRQEIERYNVAGMKGVSEIAPNFYKP